MVSCDAIIFGNRDGLLKYNPGEHPVGLQIGGSSIEKMTEAAIIGEAFGYDEINLNIDVHRQESRKETLEHA